MQLDYVDLYYLHWPLTDKSPEGNDWCHKPLEVFWNEM